MSFGHPVAEVTPVSPEITESKRGKPEGNRCGGPLVLIPIHSRNKLSGTYTHNIIPSIISGRLWLCVQNTMKCPLLYPSTKQFKIKSANENMASDRIRGITTIGESHSFPYGIHHTWLILSNPPAIQNIQPVCGAIRKVFVLVWLFLWL